MMKDSIVNYIEEKHAAAPEYPWRPLNDHMVFRNKASGKWFAVIIEDLPCEKLGITGDSHVTILNLKCDPLTAFSVIDNGSIFKAYHMNKHHWISVLLNEKTDVEKIALLIDISYHLVDEKENKRAKKRKKQC